MSTKMSINIVFVFSSFISGILAFLVIGFPILSHFLDDTYKIPEVIQDWGGVVIGYYFGTMTTIFMKFYEADRPVMNDKK